MDPITLIGLLGAVTNLIHASRTVLKVAKDFRDGDNSISALSNDLLGFSEALSGFDRVLRSRHTLHRISGSAIESVIARAKKTIESLQDRLLSISSSQFSAIRRARWIQSSSAVKKLHEQLKEQNAMLQTFLTITHAETFLAVASQYPQYMLVCSSADKKPIEQDKSSDTLRTGAHNDAERQRSLTMASRTSDVTLADMESLSIISSAPTLVGSTSFSQLKEEAALQNSSDPESSENTVQIDPRSSENNDQILSITRSSSSEHSAQMNPQEAFVVRQACRYNCYCKCHEQDTTKDRRRFHRLRTQKMTCTDANCLNIIEETFEVHSKLFSRALSQVMSSKSIKVRYNLNTYRMVPEGSDALRYIKHGRLEKLQACIESGEATIYDTAPDGWSLLHTAAYNRQLPIVKYLMKLGLDTEVGDFAARTPGDLALLKAIGQDATQVEKDILNIFSEKDDCLSDFEFTPIHIAVLEIYDAADRERPSVEELIQATDDANNAPVSTDWSQWKAKYKGRSPLFANIIECFRESSVKNPGTKVIHDLVNRRSKKVDWTPLHWAVYSGRVDAIKTLVSLGADPFILSDLNTSIIHAGAESKKDGGLAGALKIWKNYPDKLSINQLNRWGETALHLASWSSSACVKLLLEAGAAADIQEENGQVPLHCAGLSGRGPTRLEVVSLLCATNDKSHINIQDLGGRPPLFDLLDDPECIEILLRNGAKLSLTDTEGNNAFHHVCIQNEPDSLAILLRLAEDEADAVVSNDAGNTPLMEAILNTHVACAIQILGLKNVGGTTYSKEGWAPIHYAAKMGDVELLSAVLKHNSFVKGMKTIDGRKAEFIAMEAGTWEGEVKRLIREYDSLDWID